MKQNRIALVVAAAFLPSSFSALADTGATELPEVRVSAAGVRAGSPNDVVVTGSKTDTPLKDLPATVVVVPAEVIRQQAVVDMNRAMDNASGVQPVMAGGYGFANNYAVRGLPMRFLRDGFSDGPSQNGYWRTMYDIERIEVLKGPGSALYGSGQPGGTVNVVTRLPRNGLGAEIGALVGGFGTWGSYGDVWGGVGDNVATRLIADVEHSDGFRGLSRDIKEISPSFAWTLGSDQTLTVDYDHRDIEVKPDNYGTVFDNAGKLGVSRDARFYSPMNSTEQTIDRVTVSHEWRLQPNLTMRTAVVHDQRDLHLLRNGGGNAGNAMNQMTSRQIRDQVDDARFSMLQHEWLWKTRTGAVAHTVLGGVEYNTSANDTVRVGYNLQPIEDVHAPVVPETSMAGLTPTPAQGFDREIAATTWGLYLQDQLEFGEHFKVRAGLRADRVDADDVGVQGMGSRTIEVNDTMTSGSLGGVWQPTRDVSLYAGYSSGAFLNLATEAPAMAKEPETSSQFEIGTKASFLGGRANATIALFESNREHYYITLPGASDPTPDGKDRTRGVELDMSARPLAGLSLLASLVVQDAETLSQNVASNAVFGVVNRSIAGTRPTGVARQSGRLWGAYEFQGEVLRGWGMGLGATYKGDSYADNLNLYRVPSYTIYDAAVFYKAKKWDANLKLNNLADRTYYTNPTFSGALPGESRNAMLTARVRF